MKVRIKEAEELEKRVGAAALVRRPVPLPLSLLR